MIKRVDIGKSIPDGTCQGGATLQIGILLGDRQQRLCGTLVLILDPRKYRFAQFDVRDIGRYFPDFRIDQLSPER